MGQRRDKAFKRQDNLEKAEHQEIPDAERSRNLNDMCVSGMNGGHIKMINFLLKRSLLKQLGKSE